MHRVIHVEPGVRDPEPEAGLYTEVFGWKAAKWEGPRVVLFGIHQSGPGAK